MRNNVPALVQQIRENMMDNSNPENIRYNYMISMENIRDFADRALHDYSRASNKKARR